MNRKNHNSQSLESLVKPVDESSYPMFQFQMSRFYFGVMKDGIAGIPGVVVLSLPIVILLHLLLDEGVESQRITLLSWRAILPIYRKFCKPTLQPASGLACMVTVSKTIFSSFGRYFLSTGTDSMLANVPPSSAPSMIFPNTVFLPSR